MKLSDFYKNIVRFGAEIDPRGKSAVTEFQDTAILHGNPDTPVNKLMVGIDIEIGEIMLAERLREIEGLDLVLSHHPEGKAYASLYKVMDLQVNLLVKAGLPEKLAREMLTERQHEVERRLMAANHTRSCDAAKILDIPFMCAHTPADNHVSHYLGRLFKEKKPKKVSDVIDILMEIPEYKLACEVNAGPKIIIGSPNRKTGEIFMEMTGGTEGSSKAYDKLYKKGTRTLIGMHLSEDHFKKIRDMNLNVVIAGHISSDTLGLNLLLDKIEKSSGEKFNVINCAGFNRIKRI